jgi:hypothetical protein
MAVCRGSVTVDGSVADLTLNGPERSRLSENGFTVVLSGNSVDMRGANVLVSVLGTASMRGGCLVDAWVDLSRCDVLNIDGGDWNAVSVGVFQDNKPKMGVPRRQSFMATSSRFEGCRFYGVLLDAAAVATMDTVGLLETTSGLVFVDQERQEFSRFSRRNERGDATVKYVWVVLGNCAFIDALAARRMEARLEELFAVVTANADGEALRAQCKLLFGA